jgi:hypothetical protein
LDARAWVVDVPYTAGELNRGGSIFGGGTGGAADFRSSCVWGQSGSAPDVKPRRESSGVAATSSLEEEAARPRTTAARRRGWRTSRRPDTTGRPITDGEAAIAIAIAIVFYEWSESALRCVWLCRWERTTRELRRRSAVRGRAGCIGCIGCGARRLLRGL